MKGEFEDVKSVIDELKLEDLIAEESDSISVHDVVRLDASLIGSVIDMLIDVEASNGILSIARAYGISVMQVKLIDELRRQRIVELREQELQDLESSDKEDKEKKDI